MSIIQDGRDGARRQPEHHSIIGSGGDKIKLGPSCADDLGCKYQPKRLGTDPYMSVGSVVIAML